MHVCVCVRACAYVFLRVYTLVCNVCLFVCVVCVHVLVQWQSKGVLHQEAHTLTHTWIRVFISMK
jgi:hypothetical protein